MHIEDVPTIHFAPDGYETVPMLEAIRPYGTAPLRLRDALIEAQQHNQATPAPQPGYAQLCHDLFMSAMAFFMAHHHAPMSPDLSMTLQALPAVANASPDAQRIALERGVAAVKISAAAGDPAVDAALDAAREVLR